MTRRRGVGASLFIGVGFVLLALAAINAWSWFSNLGPVTVGLFAWIPLLVFGALAVGYGVELLVDDQPQRKREEQL